MLSTCVFLSLQVRAGLVPLITELRSKGTPPNDEWLKGSYDIDKQAALCKEVALELGFNINNGRLDVSVHPFTGEPHVLKEFSDPVDV